MDSTDGHSLVGVFYDDERVAELEKKVSILTTARATVSQRAAAGSNNIPRE